MHHRSSHTVCVSYVRSRAAQTVHPLGVHSSRNSRDCTNRADRAAISSRLCGLKLVYPTLSNPQLSYLVHFARLTQTAAIEVVVNLVEVLAQICSDRASRKWRISRSQSTSSERSP